MAKDKTLPPWVQLVATPILLVFLFAADARWNSGPDDTMAAEMHELYVLHERRDADGIPLWYVPRSQQRAIEKQTEVLRRLTAIIEHMYQEQLRGG